LPKKYDRGTWKLKNMDCDYMSLANLNIICAKVFYINVMEKFILSNKDTYYYIISKEYVEKSTVGSKLHIPKSEEKNIIKEKIIKFGLLPDCVEFLENE